MIGTVPKIDMPDSSAWSEDAEIASAVLSRPRRAEVMAFLNSDRGRKGVTRQEIVDATGATGPIVTEALRVAEAHGLVTVQPRRKNEGHGANIYMLDWQSYERAVLAWTDFVLGR